MDKGPQQKSPRRLSRLASSAAVNNIEKNVRQPPRPIAPLEPDRGKQFEPAGNSPYPPEQVPTGEWGRTKLFSGPQNSEKRPLCPPREVGSDHNNGPDTGQDKEKATANVASGENCDMASGRKSDMASGENCDKEDGEVEEQSDSNWRMKKRLLKTEGTLLLEKLTCSKCKVNCKNTVLLPCGHVVYCKECSDSCPTCPMCGEKVAFGTPAILVGTTGQPWVDR